MLLLLFAVLLIIVLLQDPVLVTIAHIQIITPPPPCLTVGMRCFTEMLCLVRNKRACYVLNICSVITLMTVIWYSYSLISPPGFPHPSLFRSAVATEYPKEDASSSPQKICCGTSRYTLSFLSSTTAPVWLARGAPATNVSSLRLIIPLAESTENPGSRWRKKEEEGSGVSIDHGVQKLISSLCVMFCSSAC